MKWVVPILMLFACAAAGAATSSVRPFEDYQSILDRKPFGAPPDASQIPERVVPVSESFAATLKLSGIYELDDGNLRVAVEDKRDNSYFSLVVGEKNDQGIELIDADNEKNEATLQKGDEVVVLPMNDTSGGGQVLTTLEREDRVKMAEERRMSYAERRRQRMLERQKPIEVPKPMYTGEELEKHLQDYQMQVIREGLPPLPVQLTPDRDAQLVAEGLLPPVDDQGYELEPAPAPGNEIYPDQIPQ